MTDEPSEPTPQEQNGEEGNIQAMADSIAKGLEDPRTRRHMNRLTGAAMGDELPETLPSLDRADRP